MNPINDPEARLAATYDQPREQRRQPASPTMHGEMSAEDKLAATYDRDDSDAPADIQHGDVEQTVDDTSRDAENQVDEQRAHGDAKPFAFKPTSDGYAVDDPGVATAITEVARELNLDEAGAQKIVDKVSPALRARSARQLTQLMDTWVAETKADPEVGGEKLAGAVADAKLALRFATPELRKLLGPLDQGGTGLGNHKEMIRFLAVLGRRVAAAERTGSSAGSAEDKLLRTYADEPAPRPRTVPSQRLSAEERLAQTYRQR